MKLRTVQGVLAATVLAGFLLAVVLPASAQSNAPQHSLSRADQEQASCIANLQTIFKAVQAYEHGHRALPNWLSDLVPEYLPDTNTLICPICRRTGQTEAPPLADPKLACSYLFEFCPVLLGEALPNAPQRTRREWKQRQMGLVGSIVPLVRCRQHASVLNLAFDGHIYESPASWEVLTTNLVNPAELSPARMFADASAVKPTQQAAATQRFPPRDPQAGTELLDLASYYNAALKDSWHGGKDNTLAALPEGLQTFGGVPFDVRGIVQLRSRSPASTSFPLSVTGIPVHQKCRKLYFLHAAGFGNPTDEGKQIGAYVVHFATNQMRLEIPIRYGQEVRDWHTLPGDPPAPKELQEVWRGQNPTSKSQGHSIRLFLSSWTNVVPDLEIESLDYVSNMATPAPFLIAVTVDSYRAPKEVAASFFHGPLAVAGLTLGGALVLAALAWIITRRTGRAKPRRPKLLPPAEGSVAGTAASFTLVMGAQPVTGAAPPAAGAAARSQPLIQLEAPGVTHTEAEMLRVRAQAAGNQAAHANAEIRRGVAAHLSRWLKQTLLRKLVADRAELLQTQQAAAAKALTMEDRLARVERQVQQQNQGYQQRIEELKRALLVAKEENRELIRAQIRQVQAEMEAARARALARAKADEGD